MTARAPSSNPALDALEAAPRAESSLTPEEEAVVLAAEQRLASGGRTVPHADIERQIAARRAAEG
jgi:hypothetical protein